MPPDEPSSSEYNIHGTKTKYIRHPRNKQRETELFHDPTIWYRQHLSQTELFIKRTVYKASIKGR